MGILWTILIGFIAGVLAKLITPGDNEPSGLQFWELSAPSSPATWAKLSAGMKQAKVLASLVRPLGRSSCFLFGELLLAGRGAPLASGILLGEMGSCAGGKLLNLRGALTGTARQRPVMALSRHQSR
jgi:hypothetical protein